MGRRNGPARLGLVLLLAVAPVAGAAVLPDAAPAHAQADWAFEQSKDITNQGTGEVLPATVRVNRIADLFDRQQVAIELEGFKASHNTNASQEVLIEYPVVVMQCRGTEPTRETCLNRYRGRWYSGFDTAAPPEQRAVSDLQSRPTEPRPYPGDTQDEQVRNMIRAEQEPFVAADGVRYLWSGRESTEDGGPLINTPTLKSFAPTDVTWTGASRIATRSVPIRPDGGNEFLFELRQQASQPSLGCTDTVACSIVVVPIMDLPCVEDARDDCSEGPSGPEPGGPNFTNNPNEFVGIHTWLAESNWGNRFVVPLSFAPDLRACDVRDSRPTIPAYGSELIDVAQQRWGAAYCTGARRSDYLPVYTQGGEYEARRQFTTRLGSEYQQNAIYTTQPVTGSPRPVAHAPSALTGFAVAFTVDGADGRQVQRLTLSPRLLAKLLTQSYNPTVIPPRDREGRQPYTGEQEITDDADARAYYVAHPYLLDNPRGLFADPEFAELNPDVALTDENGALAGHLMNLRNPVIFTEESDIVLELFRYITSDPAARAWLDGRPDRWGMRVNPAWRGTAATQLYTLLDTWVRTPAPRKPNWLETADHNRYFVYGGGDTCDEFFATPYLTRLANITDSAESSATSLLDRRGSATPACASDSVPIPEDEQADEPQFPGDNVTRDVVFEEVENNPDEYGQRALLAITTVAHAALYELPTARLVNSAGRPVAPTPGTMVAALNAAVQDPTSGTVRVDHRRVAGGAYPGTMVAYTAAPTSGLDRTTAARYADLIEFMATDGQTPGDTLADLPPGYDPLPPAMVRQALDAAAAVREQQGRVPVPPAGGPLGDGPPDALPAAQEPGPGSGVPPETTTSPQDTGPESAEEEVAQVARTEGEESWLARWAIPLLIGFGLLAALVAFGTQVASRPDHPLRRALAGLVRR
ncbi:hypothetical protein [Actinophytocola gossypii]|uniref:PBP domain-containing protein n=1 Tax=Actinophytocola gossypii TaxID=2812003 RepID=A0ABT2J9N5_9PSEU|nr:hypothetical protein [Actinophytocola gossypii]MCT2584284.1 hypothetical protein [Actinophytocola gossypii]